METKGHATLHLLMMVGHGGELGCDLTTQYGKIVVVVVTADVMVVVVVG